MCTCACMYHVLSHRHICIQLCWTVVRIVMCAYMHIYVCVYVFTRISTYLCMYFCMYLCMYVYMYACTLLQDKRTVIMSILSIDHMSVRTRARTHAHAHIRFHCTFHRQQLVSCSAQAGLISCTHTHTHTYA